MTTHDTNVAVALSSYCGERYLSEQIDSVLNQNLSSDVSLTLYIRDDDSTDGTVSLLDTYNSNPNIQIIKGHNLGVVGSFFDCMKAIPETYDYIALCDQDDIWMPDKLSGPSPVFAQQTYILLSYTVVNISFVTKYWRTLSGLNLIREAFILN